MFFYKIQWTEFLLKKRLKFNLLNLSSKGPFNSALIIIEARLSSLEKNCTADSTNFLQLVFLMFMHALFPGILRYAIKDAQWT
jgi:hypothetical protein